MRVEDVHAIQLERAKVNHATYKKLFEACCSRIKALAKLPRSPTGMVHHVPVFLWGHPPYKHAHAVRYVREKLARNGFDVTETGPGALYIRWGAPKKLPPPPPPPGSKKSALSAKLAAALQKTRAGAR